jgi:hypothetical protein
MNSVTPQEFIFSILDKRYQLMMRITASCNKFSAAFALVNGLYSVT